ncbi:MAG: PhzF family phenazine biosynthesis protein [Magnetovibrionaceae bacterium]
MAGKIPLWQLDAFADRPFGGNPAAVVCTDQALAPDLMQAIAAENNLAETAFLVPLADDGPGAYGLRWFTPEAEVDLCGHATLASGAVVLTHLAPDCEEARFETVSGLLRVRREGSDFSVDLPAEVPEPSPIPEPVAALFPGDDPTYLAARKGVVVLPSARAVRDYQPDFAALSRLETDGLIITAPGDVAGIDFVSRYFAPHVGIPEDPVTGSAHCILVSYWAEKIGKSELSALQVSARGGRLNCRKEGRRVHLSGGVRPYLEGFLLLD